MNRHLPSAKRVSKASELLPEPLGPTTAVMRSWGMESVRSRRLFWRSPSMTSSRVSAAPPSSMPCAWNGPFAIFFACAFDIVPLYRFENNRVNNTLYSIGGGHFK